MNSNGFYYSWDAIENDIAAVSGYSISYIINETLVEWKPRIQGYLIVGDSEPITNSITGNSIFSHSVDNTNANIRQRGGFSRQNSWFKSYLINLRYGLTWRSYTSFHLGLGSPDYEQVRNPHLYTICRSIPGWMGFTMMSANLTIKLIEEDGSVSLLPKGHFNIIEEGNPLFSRKRKLVKEGGKSWLYKVNNFQWFIYDSNAIFNVNNENFNLTKFEQAIEPKDSYDHTKIVEALNALNGLDKDGNIISFEDAFTKYIDMESLVYYTAVSILCGDYDHMGKNQYIFSNDETDKWFTIIYDMGNCLPVLNYSIYYTLAPFDTVYLYRQLFRSTIFQSFVDRLTEVIEDLSVKYFNVDYFISETEIYADTIKEYVNYIYAVHSYVLPWDNTTLDYNGDPVSTMGKSLTLLDNALEEYHDGFNRPWIATSLSSEMVVNVENQSIIRIYFVCPISPNYDSSLIDYSIYFSKGSDVSNFLSEDNLFFKSELFKCAKEWDIEEMDGVNYVDFENRCFFEDNCLNSNCYFGVISQNPEGIYSPEPQHQFIVRLSYSKIGECLP